MIEMERAKADSKATLGWSALGGAHNAAGADPA